MGPSEPVGQSGGAPASHCGLRAGRATSGQIRPLMEVQAMSRIVVCLLMAAASFGATVTATSVAAQTKSDAPAIYTDQGTDREQRLIAAAKKEGSVTFYTSMQTQESGPLSKAFEAKYGVKVQLWRATSDQVIQRIVNEARANRQGVDVLETNAPE